MASAPKYLALPNVGCIGGSWLTPEVPGSAGNFAAIEKLAAEAARL